MIRFIRKKTKSVFIYLIFGVIILVFVFWGVGNIQPGRNNVVASINNENTITRSDYDRVYRKQLNFYRNFYKENFTDELIDQLNLRERTIEGMITSILLINEAAKLNIEVSTNDVLEKIKLYPAFQSNGVFNKEIYLKTLQRERITPARFEQDIVNDLLAGKIEQIITLPVDVSDTEVKDFFNFSERRINLQYITLNASSFLNSVDISDEETRDYFNNNTEAFKVSTKIKVGYLRLRPQDFASKVKVTDKEAEEYYNNNLEKFSKEKEVKASHILIKTTRDDNAAGIEDKRKKTNEIRDKIIKGDDFASLAKEFSDDTSNADNGGDLGYFSKGRMIKSFEEAAFSMEVGEISEIVRSTFGFHIIKVTDIKESHIQSLEEVKPRIITTVTSEKAKMMALQKAQKMADLSVKDETSLKETASKEGFEVSDTGFFSKEETNNPIAVNPGLSDSAFSMSKGDISNALEIPGSVFVLAILDRQEEHLPTFDEASKSVRSFIKEQKSSEMAGNTAQEYLDQLSKGKVFSALAKDNNLKVGETGLFSLKQGFIPGMNIRTANDSPVLSLNESSPYIQLNNNSKNFVVKLKEAKTPSVEDFEKEKDQIKRSLVEMKRREFFNKWLESLRNKADIKINMELL